MSSSSSSSSSAVAFVYPENGNWSTRGNVNTPTIENNFGISSPQLRHSVSVQNPMTTLKKFWRDTKNEIKFQRSKRTS
ncbi:hypothetical protein BGZ65_000676, partial [Modicella reniformis]